MDKAGLRRMVRDVMAQTGFDTAPLIWEFVYERACRNLPDLSVDPPEEDVEWAADPTFEIIDCVRKDDDRSRSPAWSIPRVLEVVKRPSGKK